MSHVCLQIQMDPEAQKPTPGLSMSPSLGTTGAVIEAASTLSNFRCRPGKDLGGGACSR